VCERRGHQQTADPADSDQAQCGGHSSTSF
jgi:hypothetical protein